MNKKHLVVRISENEHKWIKRLALDKDLTIKQLILDSVKMYEKASGGSTSETV